MTKDTNTQYIHFFNIKYLFLFFQYLSIAFFSDTKMTI